MRAPRSAAPGDRRRSSSTSSSGCCSASDAWPTPEEADAGRAFVGKFQQITGPVTAKGIEDTAFYIYNRLAVAERGRRRSDPRSASSRTRSTSGWPSASRAGRRAVGDRRRTTPSAARTSARASTCCPSCPATGRRRSTRWRALNRPLQDATSDGRLAPDANEEYLLYQTLVGAWPFERDAHEDRALRERIVAYMTKALREAKVHTSWLIPTRRTSRRSRDSSRRFSIGAERACSCRPSCRFRRASPSWASTTPRAAAASRSPRPACPTSTRAPSSGISRWSIPTTAGRSTTGARRCWPAADLSARRRRTRADATSSTTRADGRIKLYRDARAIAALLEAATALCPAHAPSAPSGRLRGGDYVPLRRRRTRFVFAFAGPRTAPASPITCVPRLVATLTPDAAVPPTRPRRLGRHARRAARRGRAASISRRRYRRRPSRRRRPTWPARSRSRPRIFERFPVALLVAR